MSRSGHPARWWPGGPPVRAPGTREESPPLRQVPKGLPNVGVRQLNVPACGLAWILRPGGGMKVTVYDRITGDKLPHVVPPAYREGVSEVALPDGSYSVLVFAHTPRDVVPSLPVRRALRRLRAPAADGIIAVGTVFTVEALDLLEGAGAQVVAFRKVMWTDESARWRQL